jgi:hypothetical protein
MAEASVRQRRQHESRKLTKNREIRELALILENEPGKRKTKRVVIRCPLNGCPVVMLH